jgi:hypothetical protein
MFNEPTSEDSLLNKRSCLAHALGVTKFIIILDMILVTLLVVLKSDLDVQQAHLCGWFVEQKFMLSSSFRRYHTHNCHILLWSHFSLLLKLDLDVQQPRGGFVEHLSMT